MRKGFSIIEMVFAIVVMGIVASIGSDILINSTEAYLLQRTKHNSSEKSGLVATQIGNRLLYRISLSLRSKKLDGTSLALSDIDPLTADKDDYVGLEWIGYDNDGFASNSNPGWSGFVDLDNGSSNFTSIKSVGSNLNREKVIMNNITGANTNGAILFLGSPIYRNNGSDIAYENSCLYNGNCMFPVLLNNERLKFNGGDRVAGQMIYSEFYQLAISAYTVMPEANGDTFKLYLYSNYQPWLGETYLDGEKELLANNVSVFRYTQENETIRIKVCIQESLHSRKINSCKEKAVIR